jgi:hypothetical protein
MGVEPRAASREEHITATGIRFVGREAAELAVRTAEQSLAVGRDEDVLFAARFQVRPRLGMGSPVHAVLAELGSAIRETWPDAPPLTPDRPLVRPPSRFSGLSWDTVGEDAGWTGELLWRHPHPVVAGAPCTAHVLLVEHTQQASLTVRVTADGGLPSVRGMVGAGQARPAFLTPMNRALRLSFDGNDATPRAIDDMEIDAFVRDVLLSESRTAPVAVLAPLEEGGHLVPPNELADALLGLAHVYYIERHPTTFRLTDSLGDRRLSVYWGALRVYRPGFSCADRPEDHDLLVRDRVIDPIMRTELFGKLGRLASQRVTMPAGVEERRNPPAMHQPAAVIAPEAVPATALVQDSQPLPATAPPAIVQPVWPAGLLDLAPTVASLAAAVASLVESNRALTDEIARLRTTNAVRAGNAAALERRIGGLEQQLDHYFAPPTAILPDESTGDAADYEVTDDGDSVTLTDVLQQAAVTHADALLVLEPAERSAAESPFEDPERVAVILDAMAAVARRRQEGALGMSLREAFRELGIDYRGGVSATTSRRNLQQYHVIGSQGERYECEEHIVLGGTYDPRRCLRIYFTSRAPVEPRFVIGHVGRHFRVATTT